MKLCAKCKQTKPDAAFRVFQNGKNKGTRYPYCIECYNTYAMNATAKRHLASQLRVKANENRYQEQVRQLHAGELKQAKKNSIPEHLRLERKLAKPKAGKRKLLK